MTPASIGDEQQISISGGCQTPSDIRSAGALTGVERRPQGFGKEDIS